MEIYTIGFTKKSAEQFFGTLKRHGIKRVIDIRINNSSQLAGYTKRQDLEFFLKGLIDADYIHVASLAPTKELLKLYRDKQVSWDEYERSFVNLLEERRVESTLSKDLFDQATVLLCTEPTPEKCHRRLVVEYLASKWGDVRAINL